MSMWRTRDQGSMNQIIPIFQGLPLRAPRRPGLVDITRDTAFSNSVVWAAVNLRAQLISTFPVEVYRTRPDGVEVKIPSPTVLVTPSTHGPGQPMSIREWLAATQIDLDTCGNAYGLISQRNALGVPTQIDPVAAESVVVKISKTTNLITGYQIGQTVYDPTDMWHERSNYASGMSVGLSPMAYAAKTLAAGLSSKEFAISWFSNGIFPSSILKNSKRSMNHDEADRLKKQVTGTLANGEPLVLGDDWEFSMLEAKAAEADFIASMQYSDLELARFYGVPADLVDAGGAGSNITYANISQRNLQFLIMHLGPAIAAREERLTQLTPNPQRVRLNTDSLLRLDQLTLAQVVALRTQWKNATPDEIRGLYYNLPPLTADQLEMDQLLFPPKGMVPAQIEPEIDAINSPVETDEVQ